MPDQDVETKGGVGNQLAVDMVKGMVTMTGQLSALNGQIGTLIQKLEDVTAALDDHRQITDDMSETMTEVSGFLGTMIQIVDETAQVAVEKDRDVKWSDVQEVLKGLKKEAEESDEEEDEEESEK